jgi:DNA-binding LacI/PurR family transcriptional regulator
VSFLIVLSAAEQVANHLRDELARGLWSGMMPGSDRLAVELGVGCNTVEGALRLLEKEGLLANQGRRRGRLIVVPSGTQAVRRIRVAILLGEKDDRKVDYVVELEHELREAGHKAFCLPQSMTEAGMDLRRISRMVEKTEADAWVVVAGPREVLEWFAERDVPVFSLFGARQGLAIAGVGPDKAPAIAEATRVLAGLGHRRIVLLTRPYRRVRRPGVQEQAFLDELEAWGIPFGSYHLPDWKETVHGFQGCLESLFKITPPTALIVDEVQFFVAALQFCGCRGLRVPEDVSLVCTDPDRAFNWCRPSVAHIRWDSRSLARRIVAWTANVSRGKSDVRQTLVPAELVSGGTIGPAKLR